MAEYGFPLTHIFPNRTEDSVLIRRNAGRRKPIFWHILRSVNNAQSLAQTENEPQNQHQLNAFQSGQWQFSGLPEKQRQIEFS